MSHRTPSHYYEKHYLFKHDPSCFRIILLVSWWYPFALIYTLYYVRSKYA